MSEHKKQFSFEVKPKMEQRPFENLAVGAFFYKWCEINDSIRPQVMPREEWEQKSANGLLQPRPDGKQDLLIPEDLQLWEMVEIMEAIDHDTFADNPKRQKEKAEELHKLGRTFSNAGIYIAQRLDAISQGKEIAHALAEEFYEYGQSLSAGKKPKEKDDITDIALQLLNPKEIEEVDNFLAGESLYALRQARAEKAAQKEPEKKDKIYEAERQKTLAQFFRVAEKAFLLKQKTHQGELSKSGEHLKPWQSQTPIHSAFLRKVERGIEKQIEMPKTELTESIFRRGMEFLRKNMPFDTLPRHVKSSILHWEKGETTLRQALGMDKLKTELEQVRQSGDMAAIGDKEREITDKIHVTVSSFTYKSQANNPSEMMENQYINCVGASTLGGAFLSELGIKYVLGSIPRHSILLLVASDDKVEWRDMLHPHFTEELTDEEIEGKSKSGTAITVKDIVSYANNPAPEGLLLNIKGEGYIQKFILSEGIQRHSLAIFPPEKGQKMQVLANMGMFLIGLDQKKEAIEAFRQAIALDPKYASAYSVLGVCLSDLGRSEEAIVAFRQAIALDPKDSGSYSGLAKAISNLGYREEALEVYEKSIEIDPEHNAFAYFGKAQELSGLGHKEEATKAYEKAIEINPGYEQAYFNLGNTLATLGNAEEAAEAYKKAITIDPDFSYPYHGLGIVLSNLGRKKEAIEAHKQFILLADKKKAARWVKLSEEAIKKLQ